MHDHLTSLGLTTEEAKVYLALLELSSGPASVIANKAKVPRVNSYHLLQNLIHKGLVTSYVQKGIRRFSAEDPKILISQQQDRLAQAKKLVPQLHLLTHSLASKPKIHFFEGLEGIKSIYNEAAETKEELLGYSDLKAFGKLFPDFLREYCARKVKNRVKTRIISPSSPDALRFLEDFYPKRYDPLLIEIFFVNPTEFPFENDIIIFENKVAIVSLNSDELIGVTIESPVYARTEKAIFGLAWQGVAKEAYRSEPRKAGEAKGSEA